MSDIKLYRKRIMPNECVLLKDDIILEANNEYIVTKWTTLKPRCDFHHGYSCYFLEYGFKVSKFYKKDNTLKYWYCDIVDYEYNEAENSLIVTDLLADVIVYPNGYVKVIDIDEMSIALEKKLCDTRLIIKGLKNLDTLLNIIYEDKFDILTSKIEKNE